MTSESFSLLLTDLFELYNPEKIESIPHLLNTYNGREFDAIYTLYFKYNTPRISPSLYDKNLGTPKHIQYLIEEYSKGNRVLLEKAEVKESPLDEINKKISDIDKKVSNQPLKNSSDEIDSFKKIILELQKSNEFLKEEILKLHKKSNDFEYDDIEINLDLSLIPTDIKIPDYIKHCAPQTKLIIFGSDNTPYGIEVKEVIYDYVSIPGKCIKEIIIG